MSDDCTHNCPSGDACENPAGCPSEEYDSTDSESTTHPDICCECYEEECLEDVEPDLN